jgi:hypothetical protein
MKKKILIGSILAVVLLILVSFSSVIGKVSLEPVPDLDCIGDIMGVEIEPGETIIGTFEVRNIGEEGSLLDWEIQSYPEWGTFTFDPDGWIDLPKGAPVTVNVEIVLPDVIEDDLWGEILIVNLDNPDDNCSIEVFLRIKSINDATPIALVFQLISKLRNHKDIENVETENDVLQIIESDEELNSIVEQLSGNDCGCEREITLDGDYTILCNLLFPIFIISFILLGSGLKVNFAVFIIMSNIGDILDCWWKMGYPY